MDNLVYHWAIEKLCSLFLNEVIMFLSERQTLMFSDNVALIL